MTTLYLVRHGETKLNQSGVYYGMTDCGLNEKGTKQGYSLKHIYKNIDIVISSPLKRTIDTAKIISGLETESIIIDEGLKEIDFGDWEGLHYKEISSKYSVEWQCWISDWKHSAPPRGESFMDLYTRVEKSLEHILSTYKGKKILIVSHQGCLRIITSILLNMEEKAYWNFTFEHGKYSLFEVEEGHLTIRCINAND